MTAPLTFEIVAGDPRDRLDKLVVALLARAGEPATQAAQANGHDGANPGAGAGEPGAGGPEDRASRRKNPPQAPV